MKKQQKAENVKNSNIPAKPARPKLRVTEESTIVLTIFEKGAFKRRGFDESKTKAERKNLRREERHLMDKSWFIEKTKDGVMVSRDGVNWRPKREGERVFHYEGTGWVPPCEYHEVKTQVTIPNAGVLYAVSEDARPAKVSQSVWKNKPIHEKIELYLSKIADGRKFSWELLN